MDENDDAGFNERQQGLAELIRKNVRPKKPKKARRVFEVLPALAQLDVERLKSIAEIFVAMRPFVAVQDGGPIQTPPRRRRRRPDNVVPLKRRAEREPKKAS